MDSGKKCAGAGRLRAYLSADEARFQGQDEGFFMVYGREVWDASEGTIIVVDIKRSGQEIHGFGASFTDTAAIVMAGMPREELERAMKQLFDPGEGIGLSLVRNCIEASDFAPEYYTYDDMPEGEEDWELTHFDFSRALEAIVPLTRRAADINPQLLLFLAPWSPPLWMKDKPVWQAKEKPRLRRDCYGVYARYLVKAIQAYEEMRLPVYTVSAQNEPFADVPWPGMFWTGEELTTFVNDYLRPALDEAGLDTGILNVDHNYIYEREVNAVMQATRASAQGAAFHWYEGMPEQMRSVADLFPEKQVYVTEASSDNPDTIEKLVWIAGNIVRSLRSGASGYLMWNMALDQKGGPTFHDVNTHCSGLLTCHRDTKRITCGKDYYALAHFSKCIRPGARLVYSTDTAGKEYQLLNLAAQNPDGSLAVVIVNAAKEQEQVCKLVFPGQVVQVTVPAEGVVTLFREPEEGE